MAKAPAVVADVVTEARAGTAAAVADTPTAEVPAVELTPAEATPGESTSTEPTTTRKPGGQRKTGWETKFVEAFAKCGSYSKSAEAAGISARTARSRAKEGGAFGEALADAEADWVEVLEAVLFDQAKLKNNALAAFGLLRRWAPHLWNEKVQLEATVKSLSATVVLGPEDAKALLREMLADSTRATREALAAAPALAALPAAAGAVETVEVGS